MNDELKQQIIIKLGLEDLDITSQEAVFSDIGETILRQIVLDVHDILPAEKHAALKSAMESADLDGVYELLRESAVDYEALAKKAAENVLASLE